MSQPGEVRSKARQTPIRAQGSVSVFLKASLGTCTQINFHENWFSKSLTGVGNHKLHQELSSGPVSAIMLLTFTVRIRSGDFYFAPLLYFTSFHVAFRFPRSRDLMSGNHRNCSD